jgi:two-component system chemotaxis response regulator CheY
LEIDSNLKILIVDDLQSMRSTVKSILKQIGFTHISEAGDGLQALSELKQHKHDLLISDWNMPNMDGITLVRMIRGDAELKDLLVLMVTAEAEKDHVLQAISVGISDYIVKPFTADTLQSKIEKILSKKTP